MIGFHDREWSGDELDLVHPLPDRWLWSKRGFGYWCARKAEGGCWMDVWVNPRDGVLYTEYVMPIGTPRPFPPPADVALAVILAAKGLDSREAMAAALEVEAKNHREWAGPINPVGRVQDAARAAESAAVADSYSHAASIVRSGVVPT